MDSDSSRVAQVFLWKQGTAPDLGYARQVLSAANPDAAAAVAGDNPPLRLFAVIPPWPDDFWPRALADMLAFPPPGGGQWADTSRFTLSGWQGTDSRSGDKLFVVTIYSRSAFSGAGVVAPPYASSPVSPSGLNQPSLYPQYPSGPLAWPQNAQGVPPQLPSPYPYVPPTQGGPYGYGYGGQYPTGPLPVIPGQTALVEAGPSVLPDSYGIFYAGFGQRLAAGLIDFFFMSWFQLITIAGLLWAGTNPQPSDFSGWLSLYGPFICLGLAIFAVYHLVGWSVSGRTFGKKLMGIKVVRADGGVPGVGRALLRMLGYFFSTSIAGWGFLLVALDSRRQGLHDKIAETYVVPDRPAVPPPSGLPGYRPVAGALAAPGSAPVSRQTFTINPTQVTTSASEASQPAQTAAQQARTSASPQPTTTGYTAPSQSAQAQPASPPEQSSPTPQEPQRPAEKEQGASAAGGSAPGPAAAAPAGSGEAQAPEGRAGHERVGAQAQPGEWENGGEPLAGSGLPTSPLGPATEAMIAQATRERTEHSTSVDQARSLLRQALEELERGVRRGYNSMEVEPEAARSAAEHLHRALALVPNAVIYRYLYAVALRYSEGFEVAIGEFRHVLELDPGHYEARQQVAFGPRWHDAFAYPKWGERAAESGLPLPEPVRALLPQRPGTRLVLLREGGNKSVVALSRTRRDTWASLPTADMPARIELVLTRTPSGPIIAFYVVVRDDPDNPYKGETFLNPHDPGQPSDDACQLGQHMLAQLSRQDHTYLIFVDESDKLLLSRKLVFDTPTQVNIARVLYEVQTLPPQVMEPARFQQAAQWHMEHFSLDDIKG